MGVGFVKVPLEAWERFSKELNRAIERMLGDPLHILSANELSQLGFDLEQAAEYPEGADDCHT